jgi:pimeloyl-ACP methyl ester carboxylesterase
MAPKSPFTVVGFELTRPRNDPDYGRRDRSPWLDVDWPAHTHRMTIDGASVTYVDIGEGDADPVVFIHGLGACWQSWLENLPHFARDRRCIAMDLPGFGTSDRMDGEVSIERYGRVVSELLRRLEVERADIVGNSMGGFIACEVALKYANSVASLVLVSAAVLWQEYRHAKPLVAMAQVSDAVVGRAILEVSPLLARRPKLRGAALAFGGFHLPHLLPRELQVELLLTAKRTPGFLPALQALASYPLRDQLARIEVPTLVVWGTHDTLVGVEHAHELERLIPDARKLIMERTGHVPMAERPERFNEEVEVFLAETRRADARPDAVV